MGGKIEPITDKHVTIRLMLEEFQFGRALLTEFERRPDVPSGHVALRFGLRVRPLRGSKRPPKRTPRRYCS